MDRHKEVTEVVSANRGLALFCMSESYATTLNAATAKRASTNMPAKWLNEVVDIEKAYVTGEPDGSASPFT